MIRVWSSRPQLLHLGLFFVAYVLGCAFATVLGIVPGTNISIWPPGGLFIATLIFTSPYSWPWWILVGCPAELLGQLLWWHSPLPAGFLMYIGNALGAVAGAWLVNRTCRRPVRLETLREVLAFVVLAAGVAPVISATVGSATLAWFGIRSQTFAAAWPLWWIGDATGILIVAPLALVVFQNWRGDAHLSAARWIEACVLGLIFLGVAALSLSGYLPFAYIIMPPLLWAAVRFEFKGAVVSLALLALITALFTVSGAGEFAGDPESQRQRQFMLQLFLVVSALSALIVAAISRQHQQALRTLRASERELSQLVHMVPSHLWRLAPDGEPTFFSKRMVDFLGLDVADTDKPGLSRLEAVIRTVIHADDAAAFRDALNHCLLTGESFAMRYRLRRADGFYRWMSSRAEPMRDQRGRIAQWYGLCHDIDDQVHAEQALRRSERQLQQMVDAVPALIWCTTPEGIPCYLNKRAMDVTGVSFKDLIAADGSRHLTVIHPDDRDATDKALARSFETGASFVGRYRQRRSDGSHRWVESRAEPLRDEAGGILQWYGVSVDIDDLVTAQAALRDRERELSLLVDMVPTAIARLSPDGEPTFANKRLTDFLGVDVAAADKPGMSRLEAAIEMAIHPDDGVGVREKLKHSLVTGERFSMRYRMRRADGVYRWVDARAEPLRDQSGTIAQWYAVSIDIEEEVRAQQALRDRERELALLVDMVPSLIWRLNPDGEPIFFNKRLVDFFGLDVAAYNRPGMTGLAAAITTLVHPDDAASVSEALKRCFVTGDRFFMKYRLRRADGVYRWVEACAEPLRDQGGRIVQWYGLSHDIDDLIHAEEALRRSERQLQQMIDAVPVQIWSATPDGQPAYINKRYQDHLGISLANVEDREKLRNARILNEIIHPEDAPGVVRRLSECIKTGDAFMMRYRRRGKDRVYRWTEGRAEALRDQHGAIVQWYGVSVDIDDEVRAQEALRRSEQRLQQMIDAVPIRIWSVLPEGGQVYFNKRYQDYLRSVFPDFEALEEQRIEQFIQELIHPEDAPGVQRTLLNCFDTGGGAVMRFRWREKEGAYRWSECRVEPRRDHDGAIVQWYGASIDIEDEVRAQEALRQASDKLAHATRAASLAELSASIAHEVNQPLAAIVANSHACERWLSVEPPNVERAKITIGRIIRDANATADVVGRIRALFKRSIEARVSAPLASIIAEARDLMADEAVRRSVRMDVEIEGNLPPVTLDRVQIQQVLINLIRNGMDAMDAIADTRVLALRVRRSGNVIQTEISDRGPGVEFADKIFEPFFTTKENGMGMGLAICRSIVESHGGRLWAERSEPQGARFVFTLPVEVKTVP